MESDEGRGYCIIIVDNDNTREYREFYNGSVCMELYAVKKAIKLAKCGATIYTKSKYVEGCLTKWYKKWIENDWKTNKGRKVKNKKTIISCLNSIEKKNIKIRYDVDDEINNKNSKIIKKDNEVNVRIKKENEVKIGDVGQEIFSTAFGRSRWYGFTVREISKTGKKILLDFHNHISYTEPIWFEWRRPGHWIPKGKTARDYRCNSIVFGEGTNGCEPGFF